MRYDRMYWFSAACGTGWSSHGHGELGSRAFFWGGGGLDNIISSDVGFWGLFFGGLELRGYTWLAGDNGRFNHLIYRVGNVKIFLLMIIIYCTWSLFASRPDAPSTQRLAYFRKMPCRQLSSAWKKSHDTKSTFAATMPSCYQYLSTGSTIPTRHQPQPTPTPAQYLFRVGSGLGLLVALLSSRPRCRSHFLVPSSSSRSSSALGSLRWMKLQKPPRTQPSPLLSRQQASRKSVTGESSQ